MDYAEFRKKFGISEKQAVTKPPVDSEIDRDSNDHINNELDIKDNITVETNVQTSLSALSKDELLEFADKRKLYDKSYKDLEPEAIIPKVLEKARDKIVEAKLKTPYEVASLAENDLIALFDTIVK